MKIIHTNGEYVRFSERMRADVIVINGIISKHRKGMRAEGTDISGMLIVWDTEDWKSD